MNKTPQQIKNEVEKEIEKLRANRKLELIKGFPEETDELIERFLDEERHDFEFIWGNPRTDILEAQLSILTEYDKSIKEMIERMKKVELISGVYIDKNELLLKIEDNSEVEK